MSSLSKNINDQFFDGIYQDVWRKLIPVGLSEAECDFIIDVCDLQTQDAVLDIMCGYGRHVLELAQRGYRVTAVDNSQAYIEEIAAKAADQKLLIDTEVQSALSVSLKMQYKVAICMGNSLAFFDKPQTISLLQKLSDHLLPGGTLVINSWMIAEIAIKHFREREWTEVDGYKYMMTYRFEFMPSRIESQHTILAADGRVETINGVDYIFSLSELDEILSSVGLMINGLYSTPRKRPFRMGDNRIYITAQKAH